MTTTTKKAVQTTEAKARAAATKCHLIKWYDGVVSSVWRYASAEEAEEAAEQHETWMHRFRQGYLTKGMIPPDRPWKLEIV